MDTLGQTSEKGTAQGYKGSTALPVLRHVQRVESVEIGDITNTVD